MFSCRTHPAPFLSHPRSRVGCRASNYYKNNHFYIQKQHREKFVTYVPLRKCYPNNSDRTSSLNDPDQHWDHGNNKQDVNNHANIPNREAKQPPDKEKNEYRPKHGSFLFLVNTLKAGEPFVKHERHNHDYCEHDEWLEECSCHLHCRRRLPQRWK